MDKHRQQINDSIRDILRAEIKNIRELDEKLSELSIFELGQAYLALGLEPSELIKFYKTNILKLHSQMDAQDLELLVKKLKRKTNKNDKHRMDL